MTDKKLSRWLAAGAVLLWLNACSHTPSAGDIPPGATFTTKILADDTKLFMYSQRFARGWLSGGADEDDLGDTPKRGGSPSRSAQVAQITQRGVQAMLTQNHYCREGFVVLEQYEGHGKYIVRGECRDAATSTDREKFSQ